SGVEVLTVSESGACEPFARLDADPKRVQLNDAKCDSQGRLWTGTFAPDFGEGLGALYRIDPDRSVTKVLEPVSQSNGLDWSPDGRTFYYIDSAKNTVDAFDFDATRGLISRGRTLVTIDKGDGVADGMTVDRDGDLWVAIFAKGEVRRYAPSGAFRGSVSISAPGATS